MANQQFKNLNFDAAKLALKTYLSGKSVYADHNFDGATWNLLLDVMAFTVHYVGLQSNLALSEAFLDTADLRSSIVSRAKELGYFPKQNTAAAAALQISTTGQVANNQGFYVPVGAKFSAALDGETFIFQSEAKTRLYEVDGFNNIPLSSGIPTGAITGTGNYKNHNPIIIKQGFESTKTFTVADPALDTFVIADNTIDADTITVKVNNRDWQYSDDIVIADETSEIFYLQEVDTGTIEIYFGDGILGKALDVSDIIDVRWISTKAEEANDIGIFELDSTIQGLPIGQFVITTLSNSSGGTPPESDESIKKIAPKVYATQNRLVTAEDFEALIIANFSYIDAISVWGGEEAIPPEFGKVFASLSKLGVSTSILTDLERANIFAFMQQHKVVGIRTEILDPEYLVIDMEGIVRYSQYKTTKTDDELIEVIVDAIAAYYSTDLVNFNSSLKMSRLLAAIDASEESISDSNIVITLYKNFQTPLTYFNAAQPIVLNFGKNPILAGSFSTSIFDSDKQLKDDGLGNIFLYINGIKGETSIGTIDYILGTLIIPVITIADVQATTDINAARTLASVPLISPSNPITSAERLLYFVIIKFIMAPDGYNITTSENNLIARGVENITLKLLNRED